MPTYEYTCRDCGHTFDIVQKMTEDTLTICPRCGGRLRKVFAAPAIAFKGSGFYATDYGRKKSSAGSDSGSSDSKKDSSSDSNSKSESKSESKSKDSSSSSD